MSKRKAQADLNPKTPSKKKDDTCIEEFSMIRPISPIPFRQNLTDYEKLDLNEEMHHGILELADGTIHKGFSFGAKTSMSGEVVFNTGMVGYPEALTDPSYCGQILVLTFPLIGNYGVPNPEEKDEYGLSKFMESEKIQISGLIVANYSQDYSHWNSCLSLGDWLQQQNIPALYAIDTRALTKHLRELGTIVGKIQFPGQPIEFDDPNTKNLVAAVSTKKVLRFPRPDSPRIIAYDCGIKFNIVRYLLNEEKVDLTVVPFDYDLETNPENIIYDGIFISNGPGNPEMCTETIKTLRWILGQEKPKPVFGICLGNQLLALAAGARTYKLKYGNRGMNQPAIDMRTTKCYITPQNHGFAVDMETLPYEWKTFFLNANDKTNEGIIHRTKPFLSVQFHPEACGGPTDTAFLFKIFIDLVQGAPHRLTLLDPGIYDKHQIKKVLLLGSGGLSIGQAGEFDYSGSQAIKALKEEGIRVVLINPNIATVQTSHNLSSASPDKIYFLPVAADAALEVIKKENPDGIVVSMGGQTALNVGIELFLNGTLAKYKVKVLGTPIPVIMATEDRDEFSKKLAQINERLAIAHPATSIQEAVEAANKIGYPVLIRAAYALGGLGSGFAHDQAELEEIASKAFTCSTQIIVDQDLRGWKEVEYEVVRDCRGNCITVCNMENFDPLGIHTGDSIVVAPSQTLTNSEYFKLRQTALKVVRHLGIVGECNIQYALHPSSEEYCIIEVNARLSRSSALASKATGYPLAYVAAKLALGIDLVTIRNSITKITTACFEPSLDYCVVKMPRWDLKKFNRVSRQLGSSMISVGEVMAIGRNFEEAIQKAIRMVNPNFSGLDGEVDPDIPIDEQLRTPTDTRVFAVQAALEQGFSIDYIHGLSKIDKWFLSKLRNIAVMKQALKTETLHSLGAHAMRALKCCGFSDRQIATNVGTTEFEVRKARQAMGIRPRVKQIDTLAAEYPAQTNYLYMTYNGSEDDLPPDDNGIMVLGCGAYCIGSSVEFDWCAVSCVRQLRKMGRKAIVVNYNPETVSTDYDESDRLYFEELSLERVLDIYEYEKAGGVVVSVGGQIPNNLAKPLHEMGVKVLGTSPNDIDRAEDRHKFSALLDSIGIDQPAWRELTTIEEAERFADEVGYPVLVRPSFVLSGAAMNVASNVTQLKKYLDDAAVVADDKPVVISKFVLNAKEIEFDAVSQEGKIINYAISEHVENAGVHSGDATLVLPAQKLYVESIRRVKRIASDISKALHISGPFNIQLLAKENMVKVIECNLRASRTFPFISKTLDVNFITLATRAMLGVEVKPHNISLLDIDYVGVKAPMFSFTRLRGADPTLGVEMASTGEVACFGSDVHHAFWLSLRSSGFKIPSIDKGVIISIAEPHSRHEFMTSVKSLLSMGFQLYGTPGTSDFYTQREIEVKCLHKQPADGPNLIDYIKERRVGLVINIPEGSKKEDEITAGYLMRRAAVDFGCGLITNIKCAIMLVEAMEKGCHLKMEVKSMEDYYGLSKQDIGI